MSSYSYRKRHLLPQSPGIYYLRKWRTFCWTEEYIGKSTNVNQRWNCEGSRQHQHLYHWRLHQQSMRLTVRPCWRCNLDYREAIAIQRLKPRLNKQQPRPQWSPLVLAEDLWRGLPWAGAIAVLGWIAVNA